MVLVGQEGMRAHEEASGAKQPVVRKPRQHARVLWDHTIAPQRHRSPAQANELGMSRLCLRVVMLGNERARLLVVRPDVYLAELGARRLLPIMKW